MKHDDIYDKTETGKQEINDNAAGLSMMERRVLILVNGENENDKLARLSLCDDLGGTVDRLLELGLIEATEPTVVEVPAQPAPGDRAEDDTEADEAIVAARDLMCSTLQTFGNKFKIAALHKSIAETGDLAALKDLVDPWYHALSETPGGMYQADDLRREVLALIQREEAA